jgi:hypothetical protein
VKKALATLPWVEQDSVKTDVNTHEVRFKLKERKDWNEEKVRSALKEKNFPEMTVKQLPP